MRQSDCANTEFIKCAQQIQIVAERLDTFQGNEKADLFGIECARNFIMRATNDAPLRLFGFGVKPHDLIKRYLQPALRKISVFDVNRRTDQTNAARFELRQKFRGENIWLSALFVQIHRQVEMHVDKTAGV